MTFFYKFGKKARVYYTLSISRGGGAWPPGPPPWIRHCTIYILQQSMYFSMSTFIGNGNVYVCTLDTSKAFDCAN